MKRRANKMADKKDEKVVMPDENLFAVQESADVAESFDDIPKKSLKDKIVIYFKPEGTQREILRYKGNSVSQLLVFFGLACFIAGFSTIYGYITTVDFVTGLNILFGILILLFSFLCSQEMKNYKNAWNIVSFVLGGLVLLDMLYAIYTHNQVKADIRVLDDLRFTVVLVLYIIGAAAYVVAGIIGLIRTKALKEYLATQAYMEGDRV